VYPGNKITLIAALPSENESFYLYWSSSNTPVATVYGQGSLYAVITALTPGTATIGAVNQFASGVSGTYTVTVSPVPVSSVSLDKASWELVPNGTFTLNAAVAPDNASDKTVNWSVSPAGVVNLSAATGSSITVTGATTGSATITAASGGKTAACAVNVKAGSGLAITFAGFGDESIDLSPNHLNDLSWLNYDQLTVTVNGNYASITWYMDGQFWGSMGSSYNLNASGHSVGVHYLTVAVKTNDSPPKYFSKELSFRVVE
jgi:hypothetical protein